eukprot:2997426-Prymnesium_polylepis.1
MTQIFCLASPARLSAAPVEVDRWTFRMPAQCDRLAGGYNACRHTINSTPWAFSTMLCDNPEPLAAVFLVKSPVSLSVSLSHVLLWEQACIGDDVFGTEGTEAACCSRGVPGLIGSIDSIEVRVALDSPFDVTKSVFIIRFELDRLRLAQLPDCDSNCCLLSFTLPFKRTRFWRSAGESDAAPPIVTSSEY